MSTISVQDLAVALLNYCGLFYLVLWFLKIKTLHLPLRGFQTWRIRLWSTLSRTARVASLFSRDRIKGSSILFCRLSQLHRSWGTSHFPVCSVSLPSPVCHILLWEIISLPTSFNHASLITKPSPKVWPKFVMQCLALGFCNKSTFAGNVWKANVP